MISTLMQLPPEHLSLINSLIRNPDIQLWEVARQTYPVMGNVGHPRTERGWYEMLHRHRANGGHLRCVRQDNLLADRYAVSDLTITAIEAALAGDVPVSIPLLNILRSAKVQQPSLMDRFEAEVNAKIAVNAAASS